MSKVAELTEFFTSNVFPDDIISRIFAQMNENYLPKDPAKIHRAIYDLKQEDEFKEILEDFSFDQSGLIPYSHLLDRILFRLEASSVLHTLNPKFEKYEISQETKKKLLDEVNNKFLGNQDTLTNMARKFEEYIKR